MATKSLTGVAGIVVALASSACVGSTGGENSSDERSGSPSSSIEVSQTPALAPTHTPKHSSRTVKTTRCSEVVLPDEGLGEADFGVDTERQLLTINFSDMRQGSYRNVSYTVRYDADPSCADTPQMAEVIGRVVPGR